MFLNFKKVLGVGVALLWCCNASIASTVVSKISQPPGQGTSNLAVNGRSMPGSLKALLQEALPAPSIAAALSKPQSGWTQGPTETGAGRPPDLRQASVSPTPQKERAQENLMSGEAHPLSRNRSEARRTYVHALGPHRRRKHENPVSLPSGVRRAGISHARRHILCDAHI